LLGSGKGADAEILPITFLANATQAMETMKQLAEEKTVRAQEKAKRQAWQQA
jgi:hypothetical protein